MAILRTVEEHNAEESAYELEQRDRKKNRERPGNFRQVANREREEGRQQIQQELSELREAETGRQVIIACGRHFFAVRV